MKFAFMQNPLTQIPYFAWIYNSFIISHLLEWLKVRQIKSGIRVNFDQCERERTLARVRPFSLTTKSVDLQSIANQLQAALASFWPSWWSTGHCSGDFQPQCGVEASQASLVNFSLGSVQLAWPPSGLHGLTVRCSVSSHLQCSDGHPA